MPVSSVPPAGPTAPARGSAAARADFPLPIATPAATDGAGTAAANPRDPQGPARASQRKAGGPASDPGTTADAPASAKHVESQTSHTRAANASASLSPSASFGATLSATRAATTAPTATPVASAVSTVPTAPGLAPAAAAKPGETPNPAATADRGRSADTRAAAPAARAATSATETGADAAPTSTAETEPSSDAASLHEGDAADRANTFSATAREAAAALPQDSTPPAASTAVPASISAPASISPAASDPDAVAAGTASAPVDVATRAVATPAQLLAQLDRSLGESTTPGGSSTTRTTDDAPDVAGAQPGVTSASLDAASQPGEPPRVSSAAADAPLHAEVGSAVWSNELGARLTLMAQQGIAAASLRLSPAHLGPLEVRIAVRDNSASVWFGAQESDTRAALEQALPRLRELFAGQGLNLTHAGVSGETPRGAPHHHTEAALPVPPEAAREANAISVTSAPLTRQGLIDTYA